MPLLVGFMTVLRFARLQTTLIHVLFFSVCSCRGFLKVLDGSVGATLCG